MGTVVEFPANRVMPVDGDRLQAHAEVVIFPGIRIERREFSLADRVVPRRKGSSPAAQPAEADPA
jgi:hypothetical protein